jgi:hypothetical protein
LTVPLTEKSGGLQGHSTSADVGRQEEGGAGVRQHGGQQQGHWAIHGQGSIKQNSISAVDFSDKFSSSHF